MVAVAGPTVRGSRGEPVSMVETIGRWLGRMVAARRSRRARSGQPGVLARVGWWLGELFGTVLGLAAFTVCGFLTGGVWGWAVVGVAVFWLDASVASARRKRRAER